MRSRSLLAVVLVIPLGALAAQREPGPLAAPLMARVSAYQTERAVPGVSVALLRADGAIEVAALGLADVENDVPVTPATMFRLASISKPITAVIALRLWERGQLDLDRPVHELVPEWPAKAWPLTCRHLLGHLGGVRHYAGDGELRSNRHYADVRSALPIFAADDLLFEPGTQMRYSTYGYNLVGAACAVAAGRDFRLLLQQEVVEVAGLTHLQLDDQDRIIRHRAQGYRRGPDGVLLNAVPVDTSNKVPGGGLIGTAEGLVRFAGAMLDGRLVREDTRRTMWTSMRTTAGERTGYGMGFGVLADPDGDAAWVVQHTGAQPRVSTILRIDVDAGIACAVLCNLEGEGRELRELAAALLAE
ncbi:MAG: beta-lactamase family protein [Planctomycetes bacterium]|nr:beta-lactamase family protein [Planctomycetota bacterium]